MIPCLVLTSLFFQNPSSLDELEKIRNENSKQGSFNMAKLTELNQSVFAMVDANQLHSGDDFLRAANLVSDFRYRYEVSRVRHELALAALASGNVKARPEIKRTWDAFLISTGRPPRIGGLKEYDERTKVVPAPKSIRDVISDPDKAIARAKTVASNPEVQKICDADQAVRKQDWSKLTAAQMKELNEGDRKRLKQVVKLLEQGKVVTADDFNRASLVLQHGGYWNEYCLAHELSLCSLLIGTADAAWLTAASYDRMLLSGGYRQRFGTQYSGNGDGKFYFDIYDPAAINDDERKAMHCPTLEQAMNRKWN